MAVNFKLISPFQNIDRRFFNLVDPTILDPTDPDALVEGEFLELNGYKMQRGTADPSLVPTWAYFAEKGRYEVQSIQRGPFLYLGSYEADTLIMDSTALAVGDKLMVGDVTIGTITRRGLLKAAGVGAVVVGHVTRLPANNKGYLRFVREGFGYIAA